MNRKKEAQLINEWSIKGTSYRKLASKYGFSLSHVGRMIRRQKQKQEEEQVMAVTNQVDDLPDDVQALKKALREERIKNELLNSVIDIASKELGVDIRKKSGTRQSQ